MGRNRAERGSHDIGGHGSAMAREYSDVDPADYLYLSYLSRLGRAIERIGQRHCLARYGLPFSDVRLLFALRRAGPSHALRPTDLFRTLLVTSGAITKQVDRLVANGMVERQPDPSHGGAFLIRMTERGREVSESAFRSLVALYAERIRLSQRERARLAKLCEKLLADVNRFLADPAMDLDSAA
jgi:DNA-binding MarR family transcriptional regulator